MTNMGYCRFQNTLQDLRDCELHLDDDNLSSDEQRARAEMIRLCCEIADEARDSDEIVVEDDDGDDD